MHVRRTHAVRLLLLALVAVMAVPSFAGTTAIPVVNFSFEDPAILSPDGYTTKDVPGWDLTNGYGGVYRPSDGVEIPTDGLNVAWMSGGYMSQIVGATVQAGNTYILSVDVGQRSDFPPMQYYISLYAGGILLASDNGSLHPAAGTFATSTISYTASAGDASLGQNIEIRLGALPTTGNQVTFDYVRLVDPIAATPEPTAMALLAAGLLGLASRRRKL